MRDETPKIFARALYLARQKKASGTEILQNHIAAEMGERLSMILRRLPRALLIGNSSEITLNTLNATDKFDVIDKRDPAEDDDLALPQGTYDCVISLLDVQCVNDVPGHLAQLARSLKADGVLIIAFFAGDTLHELRQSWLDAEIEMTGGVSPRVAPMIGVRELGALMQRAGLALPVADMEKTTVRYADVFALMKEIKLFGYANPLVGRSPKFVSRRFITKMAELYHTHNTDADGRVRATIETAWATAWKPHESQQKPLKPGSATHSLTNALKELKTNNA
jgi:SAM-dependent methyltransferase